MNVFLHSDLDIFMAIICLIMYWSNRNMSERQLSYNYIFRLLILSDLALLLLEAVTWVLEGNPSPANYALYYAVTMLLYVLTPVPAALWALYVNGRIYQNAQKLKTCAVVFGIPVAVCAVLSILSLRTGWMFAIDAKNVYQRGALYPLLAVVSFFPVLYASVMVLIHKKRITARLAYLMFLFMLPPVIGTIAQVLWYGTTVLWSSMTISIFLTHTNVQSSQIHLDHLTGAINRRQLDLILSDRIKAAQGRHPSRWPAYCSISTASRPLTTRWGILRGTKRSRTLPRCCSPASASATFWRASAGTSSSSSRISTTRPRCATSAGASARRWSASMKKKSVRMRLGSALGTRCTIRIRNGTRTGISPISTR